ncbi:MAG: hypothetical protein WEB13_04355 [Dehalococcoidia bacterium]
MKPQSFRQSLALALVFTAIWAVVTYMLEDEKDLLQTGIWLPFFFIVILFTMRATNRATVMMTRRFGPKPPPLPEPKAPTTERPEHVNRRRERRRRRTGGRRN